MERNHCGQRRRSGPHKVRHEFGHWLAAALLLGAPWARAQDNPGGDAAPGTDFSDLFGFLDDGDDQAAPDAAPAPAAQAPEAAPAANVELIPVAAGDAVPQQAPPERAPARNALLEEVVVTAQRRSESINDVPIAITAMSGDAMAAVGIIDTRDLGSVVPGFTAADSGYNTPVYTLRGIGFNDTTYTATSTVGVYVDEVSLPYSIMTKGANLDLERVEILKGPQGTLYGRNTTGGAINYIARKPTDTLEYGLNASYSSFQTTDVELYLSGPFGDTLKGRIALKDLRSQEGWQKSLSRPGDTLGRQDKQAVRAALEWLPSDRLSFRFTLDGWRDYGESQSPQPIYISAQNPFFQPSAELYGIPIGVITSNLTNIPLVGNPVLAPQVENAETVDPASDDVRHTDWSEELDWRLRDSYWSTALRGDWSLTDTTTLTGIASYGKVRSDGSTFSQSGLPVLNSEQEIFAGIETANLELRLAGLWGDGNHWLFGANAAFDSGEELHHVYADTVSALFPNPVTGESMLATRLDIAGQTDARSIGVFFNGDWRATDTLRLTLGARYSDELRDFSGCSREADDSSGLAPIALETVFNVTAASRGNPTFPVGDGECLTLDENGDNEMYQGELKEDNLSGRIALDWTPLDAVLFYLSYTRGYKSGGFPVTNSSDQVQYTPVTQEQLLALELGGKFTVVEGLLKLNFAAFDYDYTDKQLLTRFADPIFGPLPILRNAPRSTVRGAELDFQLTPLDGLFISAAGSYIDTRIDEFMSTTIGGEEDHDFSGRPFNFAPLLQYNALIDYSLPLGAYVAGAGLDYSYTGETNSTLEGDPRYAHRDFGITNARLRLADADGRWTLMLWGRNVFDEFSQNSVFQQGDAIVRYAGQPRTIGLTFTYQGF